MGRKGSIALLGMSEDSVQLYLNLFLQKEKSIEIPVYPTNFEGINNLLPHPSEDLKALLNHYLVQVEEDYLLVPNITIHETLEEILSLKQYRFSLIHPLQRIVEKLKEQKIREVILFGSYYTMQKGYVSNFLERKNIDCRFPKGEDCKVIDVYRKAVYQRQETEELTNSFFRILDQYSQSSVVILACTELSIACKDKKHNVLDLVRNHVQTSLEVLK